MIISKIWIKQQSFSLKKLIWRCHPQNAVHLILASVCYTCIDIAKALEIYLMRAYINAADFT